MLLFLFALRKHCFSLEVCFTHASLKELLKTVSNKLKCLLLGEMLQRLLSFFPKTCKFFMLVNLFMEAYCICFLIFILISYMVGFI